MSLGIFVEGQSDRSTIPILIRKLGHGLAVHTRVVGQGDMLKETEMSNQIAALRTLHPRLAKILVFMDSEGVDPGETLRLAKPVEARLNRMSGRATVTYIVVDHSLEGWLACDERALRAVLGRGARIRIRGSPEDDLRPARILARIFRANKKEFIKTVHDPKIAAAVSPQNIADRSPTFRRLISVLSEGPV